MITDDAPQPLRQAGDADAGRRQCDAAGAGEGQPQAQQHDDAQHALPGQHDPRHQSQDDADHRDQVSDPEILLHRILSSAACQCIDDLQAHRAQ
jgi:hypothetical protein